MRPEDIIRRLGAFTRNDLSVKNLHGGSDLSHSSLAGVSPPGCASIDILSREHGSQQAANSPNYDPFFMSARRDWPEAIAIRTCEADDGHFLNDSSLAMENTFPSHRADYREKSAPMA